MVRVWRHGGNGGEARVGSRICATERAMEDDASGEESAIVKGEKACSLENGRTILCQGWPVMSENYEPPEEKDEYDFGFGCGMEEGRKLK